MSREALNVTDQSKESEIKVTPEAGGAASRSSATEATLKPTQPWSSWWPNISLWSKSEKAAVKASPEIRPPLEATKANKDGRKEENA
jgi:hypothetical protein